MPPDRRTKRCLPSKKSKQLSVCADDSSEECRTKQKEPYDVVLIAGIKNVRLSAHWNVIARWSPVFEEAFNSNLNEVNTGEIELERIDAKTLQVLLDFMYNVPIELCCEMVESVLLAADYLQINTLVNACCDFIFENLETSNCLSIHLFSEQHVHFRLWNKTYEFLYAHFEEVCIGEEFLQLTEEQLVKFISDDCRYFRSEEKLFLSLVAWVDRDKLNREHLLLNLLNHIDFRRLELEFIDKHRHLVPQTEYLDGWSRWLEASQSKGDTSLVEVNDIKTRQTNELARVGANEPFEFQTFNPELGIWFTEKWPLPYLLFNKISLISVVDKKLIVSDDIYFKCLDFETMKWTGLQENSFLPRKSEIFESKGDLYQVSDYGPSGSFYWDYLKHDVLRKYDFSTKQWKLVKEWPSKVECVTAHDGLIYTSVVNGRSHLLESYDPTADKLTSIALNESQSFIHAMAGIGEYLYLVVDRNNTRIDRYHPSTNSWTEIGSIGHNFSYPVARCVVFNKRLLIVEQHYNAQHREMVVKEYNPATNQITSWPPLPESSKLFAIKN